MENDEKSLDEIQQELTVKQQEDKISSLAVTNQTDNNSSLEVSNTINNKLQTIFEDTVDNNTEQVKALADNAVKTELEIKNEEVVGRKEVKKSEIRKNVTQAKIEEDKAKHTRAETILKSQGLTSQLPSIYRITALIVGYPFFVVYLLSLGWVIEFLTFTIKGFITMVADCVERFTEVNAKIIQNSNNKDFKLSRAIINILKWLLIIGAVVAVVVLLILK